MFTSSGFKLWVEARSFQPGEILLVELEGGESIERAWINGCGHKFYFFRSNSASGIRHYTFVGLDGELEAGRYSFQLVVQRRDRSWEIDEFFLFLKKRDYRTRKLRVASKFITPPEELKERIEREAEIMKTVFSIITPDWLGDGAFMWPHSGQITAYFGDRRLYNDQKFSFHHGVDLAAGRGEPIVAANSGQVMVASDFYLPGKIVVIDHGLGLFTTYHHLERILVKRGQKVKKGEVIGLAGSSGLSTGPHLHCGARIGPSRIDPLSLLSLPFPQKDKP